MENINLSAEPIQVRPAHNGFIVTNVAGPEYDYKVREEYVFTSLEEMYEFMINRFVVEYSNSWDNSKIDPQVVWGGGS